MVKRRVVVIGGGVGGYPAAIRAARLGAHVTLIERESLGGVCLNKGCIPTKVLLHAAALRRDIGQAATFGLQAELTGFDHGRLMERKAEVVRQLTAGVGHLLKSKKVEVIEGSARFLDDHRLQIEGSDRTLEAEAIIIATGSVPVELKIGNPDGVQILTSDDLLRLGAIPGSVLIIGGGYIGVEFGQFLTRMGSRVTLVEMQDRILPGEDEDISAALAGALEREGLRIVTGTQVKKVLAESGGGAKVVLANGEGEEEVVVDAVAQAVGRRPHWGDLDPDRAGVAIQGGKITVNDRMQTSVPHIFAVGDVIGGVMLAHVAVAEGECAARNAMGGEEHLSLKAVPRCVYTSPEVACVGLTESVAAARYPNVTSARFPLSSVGKAVLMNQTHGMVKVVANGEDGEILGVHVLGPRATEMVAEAVFAIRLEATVQELGHTIHPHPTVSEAIQEACLMLAGGAVHLP